jgi:succinyl-CoA synthetase beta subunit
MTRCDDVARAITQVANRLDVTKPFVVRLIGTKEAEGKRILEESEIKVSDSMEEAAKRAVEASRGA